MRARGFAILIGLTGITAAEVSAPPALIAWADADLLTHEPLTRQYHGTCGLALARTAGPQAAGIEDGGRMTQEQYRTDLRRVLAQHSDAAAMRIRRLLEHVPAKARELAIEVFPSQDREGSFDVYANVGGPDLHALNEQLQPYASVFSVVHTETGLEPDVPMVEPEDLDFEVNDVIVDTVAQWLQEIWRQIGPPPIAIPVTIVGHDGYGTTTPITLTTGKK